MEPYENLHYFLCLSVIIQKTTDIHFIHIPTIIDYGKSRTEEAIYWGIRATLCCHRSNISLTFTLRKSPSVVIWTSEKHQAEHFLYGHRPSGITNGRNLYFLPTERLDISNSHQKDETITYATLLHTWTQRYLITLEVIGSY